jgi:hypothetical protein
LGAFVLFAVAHGAVVRAFIVCAAVARIFSISKGH